ncbi:MAG TPA: HemK/PrmC family methyltransferase [Acidobacteriaceae bacterium]|nr:HemK/PrmC family methyltransferase [Acidobacteriaceae bacterium]
MTLRDALLEASASISRRDAETLLAHSVRKDRAWVLAHADDELPHGELEDFRGLTGRRAEQEPLQHLTGTQEFFGIELRVTTDVLIPRPETEHLVEAVLDWAHRQSDADPEAGSHLRIADVGTGSGAIAIAIASVLEHASVTAIDISPAALAVARDNAERAGVAGRIRFIAGDLLAPLLGEHVAPDPLFTGDPLNPLIVGSDPFDPVLGSAPAQETGELDIVVSNPPYVALDDAATLAPEVRDHEPALALYAGRDGLAIYRRLIPQAAHLLRPGGLLAMEIGWGQRDAVADLLAGWDSVRFVDDYAGIARVALAIRR